MTPADYWGISIHWPDHLKAALEKIIELQVKGNLIKPFRF